MKKIEASTKVKIITDNFLINSPYSNALTEMMESGTKIVNLLPETKAHPAVTSHFTVSFDVEYDVERKLTLTKNIRQEDLDVFDAIYTFAKRYGEDRPFSGMDLGRLIYGKTRISETEIANIEKSIERLRKTDITFNVTDEFNARNLSIPKNVASIKLTKALLSVEILEIEYYKGRRSDSWKDWDAIRKMKTEKQGKRVKIYHLEDGIPAFYRHAEKTKQIIAVDDSIIQLKGIRSTLHRFRLEYG